MKRSQEITRELRKASRRYGKAAPGRERGAALIMTLILLTLLGAASVAAFVLVSSDTMINGYYRNYRGSFYAADSGVNAVVEAMENSLTANANQAADPPLPIGGVAINPGVWTNVAAPATLTASYVPFQGAFFSIGDPGSWKGQFELITANPLNVVQNGVPQNSQFFVAAADGLTCFPITTVTCPGTGLPNNKNYNWTFVYPYTVTVQGQSYGNEAEQITQIGAIVYTSNSGNGAVGGPPSMSKYGAFITNFTACQGPLVPGTETGPFFTDGQWNLGNYSNPGYTFNGSVAQAGAQVSWWSNNNCQNSATMPNGFRAPSYQGGPMQLNANPVVPPTDTYSQAQAVLDGKGDPPCTATPCPTDPAPTQAQLNATLKTISGTTYPSSGNAPSAVYIPWYTNGLGQKVYGSNPASGGDGAGGGFYVNGNATVTLSATTGGDGTNNPTQTYTIAQGGTTTTIVVDNVIGTTTVTSGGTTLALTGVPQQLDPNTGQPVTQTDPSGNVVNPSMVYVNGSITGMSGTVQNNTGITVVGSSSVSITGDITYASAPVSIPSDALVSNTNAGVLGVYTQGNINLYPNSSGSNAGNLTVNASLAALSGQTGSSANSGFETPGNAIGTWTILGGRAEDHAHSVNIGAGNTYYDQRFAGNFGPPWFPTAVPQPGELPTPASSQIKITRVSWSENRP
jgi:hypothetical protein